WRVTFCTCSRVPWLVSREGTSEIGGRRIGVAMAQDEFLDKLCAALPELSKGTDGIWRTSRQTEISLPTEGHDELATIEERSFWFAHRNRVIASLVSSIPPAGPVLDVGGGNGFVSLGLQQAGFTSVVVEPGPLGARVCQQRGVPVVQAAFQDLDIPADSVPAI